MLLSSVLLNSGDDTGSAFISSFTLLTLRTVSFMFSVFLSMLRVDSAICSIVEELFVSVCELSTVSRALLTFRSTLVSLTTSVRTLRSPLMVSPPVSETFVTSCDWEEIGVISSSFKSSTVLDMESIFLLSPVRPAAARLGINFLSKSICSCTGSVEVRALLRGFPLSAISRNISL